MILSYTPMGEDETLKDKHILLVGDPRYIPSSFHWMIPFAIYNTVLVLGANLSLSLLLLLAMWIKFFHLSFCDFFFVFVLFFFFIKTKKRESEGDCQKLWVAPSSSCL
jgi:hypothetical protein